MSATTRLTVVLVGYFLFYFSVIHPVGLPEFESFAHFLVFSIFFFLVPIVGIFISTCVADVTYSGVGKAIDLGRSTIDKIK